MCDGSVVWLNFLHCQFLCEMPSSAIIATFQFSYSTLSFCSLSFPTRGANRKWKNLLTLCLSSPILTREAFLCVGKSEHSSQHSASQRSAILSALKLPQLDSQLHLFHSPQVHNILIFAFLYFSMLSYNTHPWDTMKIYCKWTLSKQC